MYQIIEDAPALAELPNTKTLTIYKEIKGILGQCVLPLSQCKGQAYDGASNISGIRNEFQALFKQEKGKLYLPTVWCIT